VAFYPAVDFPRGILSGTIWFVAFCPVAFCPVAFCPYTGIGVAYTALSIASHGKNPQAAMAVKYRRFRICLYLMFSVYFTVMDKTIVLVLALVVCVADIAHAASVSKPQSWHVKKSASTGSDDATGRIMSKWLPGIMVKRIHPVPGPDEDHAVPFKRRQVCF